jgi:hypothetical protein
VSVAPAACQELDDCGHLPLHYVVGRGDYTKESEQLIRLIVTAYPPALKMPDRLGRLPLHLAVANNMGFDLLHELLKYHPAAAKHRDLVWTTCRSSQKYTVTFSDFISLAAGGPAAAVSGPSSRR